MPTKKGATVKQDPNPPNVVEIELKWTKDTKNFVRFDEQVDENERGHTFYLSSAHAKELGNPKNIVLVVEADYEGR